MQNISLDADRVDALKRLLTVRDDESSGIDFIITAAPQIWFPLERDAILVDVSSVLGVSSPWSGRSDSRLEEKTVHDFLAAGWPPKAVKSQYRVSGRRETALDVALLDEAGDLLVAVEVKGRVPQLHQPLRQIASQMLERANVRWAIVTDGVLYHIFERSGRSFTEAIAPRPDVFGAAFSDGQRAVTSAILRPQDCAGLESVFQEHSPSHVVVDFTLPWGLKVDPKSELRQLLPTDLAEDRPGISDSQFLLLAWAASHACVESINTITLLTLAEAASLSGFRRWLGDRLGVRAHVELPAGMFAPAASVRSSFLMLGNAGQKSLLYRVPTPGNIVSAASGCLKSIVD